MADQRKVELILGIRTEGQVDATQGLQSIGKAAEALTGELSKLERADVLKDLGATAAQVGADIGDLDAAAAELAAQLKSVGASEVEIRKVSKAFDDTTAGIEKASAKQAALNAQIEKDAEKAIAAQEKLGAAMARDVDKQIAAQQKLGATMAADLDKSAAAAERLGEQEAFAAAKSREAASGATLLQQQLGQISRAEQIQKLSTDMGALAKKTGDVSGAVKQLDEQFKELGATEQEVKSGAAAFNEAQSADSEGGPNFLQRVGSGLRGLPSVQIPGTGIGTDAIGNITRLTGALGKASGATAEMGAVTTDLTPVLGATAAEMAGVLAVAGPLVVIVGALGLAIKAFSDSTSQQVKTINSFADAQRSLNDKIADGLTSKEAEKEAEDLKKRRDLEAGTLATLQKSYDDFEKQARETAEANKGLITFLFGAQAGTEGVANAAKGLSADEQALYDQIQESKGKIEGYDTSTQTLTQAQEDGTLAANDAAEAEKKLAEERTKQVLSDADAAGKELAAQQKALAATEEQNQKRLTSIDDERAVIQKQVDVLTESGDTSEEVTKKLEDLNGQLGALGKESEFIKDTALEVSRQRDAEKKAQKDAEDAAKKAEQAQIQYTKAVEGAQKTYANAVQDLGTRLGQQLTDNTTKLNRDLTDIATKYRRDEFDLEIKSNRAERNAQQSQVDDLAQIREAANKDEQAAIQAGDFKALFLARQKAAEDTKAQTVTLDKNAAKRRQDYADAREDLLRNGQRQRQDRLTGYDRQNADARQAQTRDLQQAALTRNRALQIAAEGQKASLSQLANYWNQANKIQQQGMLNGIKIMQGGGTASGPNAGSFSNASGFASSFTATVKR